MSAACLALLYRCITIVDDVSERFSPPSTLGSSRRSPPSAAASTHSAVEAVFYF